MPDTANGWIEVDRAALGGNIAHFRALAGLDRALMVVVKANAYGHGMLHVARIALEAGAQWLGVFAFEEALVLREAGIEAPVLVLGPVFGVSLQAAARLRIHVTVASRRAAQEALRAGEGAADGPLAVHLKFDTGIQRQGLLVDDFDLVSELSACAGVQIVGAYSHFADIEDTTDHQFAMQQLADFESVLAGLDERGIEVEVRHTACTAAALLFDNTMFDMIRVGIGAYGLWPSRETLVSVKERGRQSLELRPVMAWKTRIAQIKTAPAGATVAYGRTFKTTRATRLATLPIGYSNGYSRALSNKAHVLVRGSRAKLCGRVMMNLCVVDVTDIEHVAEGDEVILLGSDGQETVSADMLARWTDTINYEVVTRAEPSGPRIIV